MPLVISIINAGVTKEARADLDKNIRENVYQASIKLGEEGKIPAPHDKTDFMTVTAVDQKARFSSAKILMVMWPRTDEQKATYKEALTNAARENFLYVNADVVDAIEEDWRGTLS